MHAEYIIRVKERERDDIPGGAGAGARVRSPRDETARARDCRWPTDAGGITGLYPPAGY